MPEWLSRQDREIGAWVVEEGAPRRGDAWTDNNGRRMRVPVGASGSDRLIRAHEMMHAKVSPLDLNCLVPFGVSEAAARSAEEFRVNTLVGVAGFDLSDLTDGSESTWGKRKAESKDWNNIVIDVAALAGTKACADFLRGMKQVDPELAAAAREVEKAVVAHWTKIASRFVVSYGRGRKALTDEAKRKAAARIGSTEPDDNGLPTGFSQFTIPLARMLDGMMIQDDDGVPGDENGQDSPEKELPNPEDIRAVAKAGMKGQFARMILDPNVVLSRRVDGRLGRRRTASNIGRNPRRMSRMLTDPERRVFDKKVKGKGGVVLIDQSGSMSLNEDDLWKIINAAPGCTIIGYSHRPGTTSTPNVWILADRGKVCEEIREGRSGNGVDGPALRFAINKRRSSEPLIWVCDGMVTDAIGDEYYPNLGEECARLVVRHGVHMVENVEQAVDALSKSPAKSMQAQATGQIHQTDAWRKRG